MSEDVPGGNLDSTTREDAHSLEADGYVDLYEINLLNGGKVAIKNNDTVSWQGQSYEGTAVQLTGVANSSDEETSRPQFSVANAEGMFSTMVRDGALDGAFVTRFRVLRDDIDNDVNRYISQRWRVRRVSSLTKHKITMELRDQLDGQFFLTPARMFIPPEFRQVSLG